MRSLLIAAVLVLVFSRASAQEKIALTTPETKPSNAEYRLRVFSVVFDDPATASQDEGALTIELAGQNGEPVNCRYTSATTPTATTLINGLNKANLASAYTGNATSGSLRQRIYHRLVVMNEAPTVCNGKVLAGTLSGNPL